MHQFFRLKCDFRGCFPYPRSPPRHLSTSRILPLDPPRSFFAELIGGAAEVLEQFGHGGIFRFGGPELQPAFRLLPDRCQGFWPVIKAARPAVKLC
jgi:hypothetical protein